MENKELTVRFVTANNKWNFKVYDVDGSVVAKGDIYESEKEAIAAYEAWKENGGVAAEAPKAPEAPVAPAQEEVKEPEAPKAPEQTETKEPEAPVSNPDAPKTADEETAGAPNDAENTAGSVNTDESQVGDAGNAENKVNE